VVLDGGYGILHRWPSMFFSDMSCFALL
jgi:hypothetical protein